MANKHNVHLMTDWTNFITAHFTVYDCTIPLYHYTNWLSLHLRIRYVTNDTN